MKFDENGNKIKEKKGKSVKESFLDEVKRDAKIIAEYFNISMPDIQLKNGFGGDYTRSENLVRIGFGDGVYNIITRRVLVHEMIHHKGHGHGRVMGQLFMSHQDRDFLSPKIDREIFKTVI